MRLAADMLDEYADRLGNDGCNDWAWPEWVSADVRESFVRESERRNGTPEDADESVVMYARGAHGPPNFVVARTLAGMLREMTRGGGR